MVEKFLVDLFRRTQKQKVAVIIDGGIVSKSFFDSLPALIEKLREIGDIKVAEVIYEAKISDQDYEGLQRVGFTNRVVASNLDLNLLSQTYDLILSDKSIDTLVLGTENENLIPLVTELRKNVTIFALINQPISKPFEESFDGIIEVKNIDEFQFTTTDLSEVESIIGSNGDYQYQDTTIPWESSDDDANIGPTSEDLQEQSDLEEELKVKESSKAPNKTSKAKKSKKTAAKKSKTKKTDSKKEKSTEMS